MSDLKIRNQKDYPKSSFGFLMKPSYRDAIIEVIVYSFILLFGYTAFSKLITLDTFIDVLSKYPLIGKYHNIVAYLVPVSELIVCVLLIVPRTKKLGMICSLVMMILFLIYITYLFLSESSMPCSCGGIVARLSWKQHIWFNSGFMLLAIFGLISAKK